MKISTFNTIEKWWWKIWKFLVIILSIIYIVFLVIQITGNAIVSDIKGHKIVYKTLFEKQECDIDTAITEFQKKYDVDSVYMYPWSYRKDKWSLDYKTSYEGQEVRVEKTFNTIGEMTDFLNSK